MVRPFGCAVRLRFLLIFPLLLVLALFAVSNMAPASLGLWPTGITVQMPVGVAILTVSACTFVLGALLVSFGAWRDRRRANRAEARLAAANAELRALRAGPPARGP
jgi:uncharacterized integral membrane protein